MSKTKLALLTLMVGVSIQIANATEYGTVLATQPNTETTMQPQQTCNQVPVTTQQVQNVQQVQQVQTYNGGGSGLNTGNIVGSVVGGALGSRFGRGNGQLASVMAGTVLGGVVGGSVYNNGGGSYGTQSVVTNTPVVTNVTQYQQVCNTTYIERKTITGYIVTIEYQGAKFNQLFGYQPSVGTKVVVDLTARQ